MSSFGESLEVDTERAVVYPTLASPSLAAAFFSFTRRIALRATNAMTTQAAPIAVFKGKPSEL